MKHLVCVDERLRRSVERPKRDGYLRAVDEAVQAIENTLAAEQFDAARDRRLERRVMRIEMNSR